jgi:hypothetical protein
MKSAYWNTINGKYHGLCEEGRNLICRRKDEHAIPDECEKGEEFTLKLVIEEQKW